MRGFSLAAGRRSLRRVRSSLFLAVDSHTKWSPTLLNLMPHSKQVRREYNRARRS